MQVVGVTTEREILVASKERPFQINEILLIEDDRHHNPPGEVIETKSFNRYIPEVDPNSSFIDGAALESLRAIGWDPEGETVHLAKVRIIDDLISPIRVGASVRLPHFSEVRHLLVNRSPKDGLVLGVIRGTKDIAQKGMDPVLKNTALLFDKEKGIQPQDGVPFIFDYRSMDAYPHIGIFGGSGSGKSFGLRVLLEELMLKGFPTIVFDPHYEMDFSTPFAGLPEEFQADFKKRFKLFVVGEDVGVNFSDLEPNDLVSLLEGLGDVSEVQVSAIQTLMRRKDTFQAFTARVNNLIRFLEGQKEIDRLKKQGYLNPQEEEYLKAMADVAPLANRISNVSVLKSISWKLDRLDREGVFSRSLEPLVEGLLQRKMVVVQGPMFLLRIICSFVTRQCYLRRREYRDAQQRGGEAEKFPPFAVVTDEAHNFAPKGDSRTPSRGILKEISQEGRKYGVFLIFATQRPALLDETITAQLNTKFVFRTVRSHDIELLKQETDLSYEETVRLPYLPSGTAYVSSAILGRSISIRIRVAKTASPHALNPFDELEEMFSGDRSKLSYAILEVLPIADFNIASNLDSIRNHVGKAITQEQVVERLQELVQEGMLIAQKGPFGTTYRRQEGSGS